MNRYADKQKIKIQNILLVDIDSATIVCIVKLTHVSDIMWKYYESTSTYSTVEMTAQKVLQLF